MSKELKFMCAECGSELEVDKAEIAVTYDPPVVFTFYPCEKCITKAMADAFQSGVDSVLVCECGKVIDTNLSQCVDAKLCETCLDDAQ